MSLYDKVTLVLAAGLLVAVLVAQESAAPGVVLVGLFGWFVVCPARWRERRLNHAETHEEA